MALCSTGITHFTVRELQQPRQTEQVLSSSKLTSGVYTSPIYDSRRFRAVQVYGNISQISGSAGVTENVACEGSVYGDTFWWTMSGTSHNTVGTWYERFPGGVYTYESSGVINNFTRFKISTNASSDGGIWSQVDVVFMK